VLIVNNFPKLLPDMGGYCNDKSGKRRLLKNGRYRSGIRANWINDITSHHAGLNMIVYMAMAHPFSRIIGNHSHLGIIRKRPCVIPDHVLGRNIIMSDLAAVCSGYIAPYASIQYDY
jgi:hypothetical protein